MMVAIWKLDFFNTPEDEINFDSFTKFSFFVFRLMMFKFKPLSGNESLREKFLHFMRISYMRFCLFMQFYAFISFVIVMILNAGNVVETARNFANAMTCFLTAQKGLITFLHRDDLWRIFQGIQKVSEQRAGQNKKYGIKKYLDGYNLLVKAYSASSMLVFVPIILPPLRYLIFGTMTLSMDFWFPVDIFKPKIFLVASSLFAWNSFNSLMFLFATDGLLYGLITFISMEFDILKIDIENFNNDRSHNQSENLHDLIHRHNKVLSLSNKLQNVYSLSFLFSFVMSSLILCFLCFQLSTAKKFATFMMYIPYLGLISGQVLLLCWFGQKMINSSELVVDGIYKCGWEESNDDSFKKQIILMTLRAQRTQKLTAMGFAVISLESFTSVG